MLTTWTALDVWIVVIGALAAVACALPGCFLVLRRMSMMGDAISHAVLPGLVVAFWIMGSRNSLTMFVGAAGVGLLTALLTQLIHRWGNVDEHASMGVVFTTLFAVGLVLIAQPFAASVDLDARCVLYGSLELAPLLHSMTVAGREIPHAAITLSAVLVVNIVFIVLLFKELKIASFDPNLATTVGYNANLLHYLLMGIVAMTTVAAFEAVGSILVVCMLIVPGAAARLLTDRLASMLLVAAGVAILGAGLGHGVARELPPLLGHPDLDMSSAGSMATVIGLLFGGLCVFAPRQGYLSHAVSRFGLGLRIRAEDALGLLYRLDEHGVSDSPRAFGRRLRQALHIHRFTSLLVMQHLQRAGSIRIDDARVRLTSNGRQRAVNLVRSHRLWERYLVDELAIRSDHVHRTAMDLEHVTSPAMQQNLVASLREDRIDPHGRVIPVDDDDAPLQSGTDRGTH
jgi:manganese/zinc/iron transport system permease protein